MILHPDVAKALQLSLPVVALESAVITHGLPHPINLELAQHLEDVIRQNGAAPATIALLEGELHIGITNEELDPWQQPSIQSKSAGGILHLPWHKKRTGGTTVAGTMIAAHRAGIRVFATGGIGGVHRGTQFESLLTSLNLHGRLWLLFVPEQKQSWTCLPPWNIWNPWECR
jgi:pseudouridine-5'-phosphate glycosidase